MSQMQKESPKDEKKKETPLQAYVRFSSLGAQVIGSVGIGVVAGLYLDKYFGFTNNIFLISLSGLMIVVALYLIIRQYLKS